MTRRSDVQMVEAVVGRLEALAGRMTELVEVTRGLALNHVLHSGTRIIPDVGYVSIETKVPYASVAVGAHAAAGDVVAVSAPPSGDVAPTNGVGVLVVPPGIFLCVPAVGTTLTVWGTPGDQVYIGIYSRLLPPTAS